MLVLLISSSPALTYSSELMSSDLSHALVEDALDHKDLPKNFRTSSFFPKSKPYAKPPNLEGLPELHIAGSDQFSEIQLLKALEYLPQDKLVIIDLRKESHGFINGIPVSWYISRNSLNEKRTPEQVLHFEKELLNGLKKESEVTIYQIEKIEDLPNPPKIAYVKPNTITVSSVEQEQELVKRHNLKYFRFFVQDFHAPDPGQVDAFLSMARNLPEDSWLYFHCRGGTGRTTTFMTMYDILKNFDKVSLEDIIYRQSFIGGKMLSELPADSHHWKFESQKDRFIFIKLFYQFIRETQGQEGLRWSDWLEAKNKMQKN